MYKSIAVPLVVAILCVGHLQAGPFTLSKIADENTAIPGGNTNFMGFGLPSIDGSNVAFIGVSPLYESGIYLSSGGTLTKIVDGNTPVPDGVSNLGGYGSEVSLSGSNVAFHSQPPLQGSIQGVYARIDGTLQVVADGSTPYAGGGFFEGFGSEAVSISGRSVAFIGVGSNNRYGVDVSSNGTVNLVADTTTGIPNGTGNFTFQYFQTSLSDGHVAMRGGQAIANPPDTIVNTGIYSDIGGPLSLIAGMTTHMPGTSGNFESVANPVIDGDRILFSGTNSEQSGLFLWDNGSLSNLVDQSTMIPGGTGTFTSFGYAALDGGNVAFRANGPDGQSGIYAVLNGVLTKVLDLHDTLDGRQIEFFSFGREGLSGNSIAFVARFADDNTEGLYVATLVPEPSTLILAALGLVGFAAWGWRRKR